MSIATDLRPIPNLDGYAASADGSVWTELKMRGRGANRMMHKSGVWRRLPAGPDKHGYRIIRVGAGVAGGGKSRKLYVHRLVLEAFVGPCPDGMECRHLNGDRGDCRPENLAWGTRGENQLDRADHGTSNRGEAHWRSKLNSEQVSEIKRLLSLGERGSAIARRYGVHPVTVSGIKLGRIWGWIS